MDDLILVVEDSLSCQKIAVNTLKNIGEVKAVRTLQEARDYLLNNSVKLVILDIELPDGNGLEFFSELQTKMNFPETPVIVTSGSSDICTKVTAFSYGAEDYLVKPYSPMELRARIERVFRSGRSGSLFRELKSGLTLDFNKFKATYLEKEEEVDLNLTPHEFKILSLFLKNPENVYSREKILDMVWGHDVYLNERTVDTHISSLRKKLVNLGISIVTIRGDGYKSAFKKPA